MKILEIMMLIQVTFIVTSPGFPFWIFFWFFGIWIFPLSYRAKKVYKWFNPDYNSAIIQPKTSLIKKMSSAVSYISCIACGVDVGHSYNYCVTCGVRVK